uniref:Uncharacterized protein n=1 Tax=Arundo donax TaxID=35708 RepID=A0A0A9AF28_ARUDO
MRSQLQRRHGDHGGSPVTCCSRSSEADAAGDRDPAAVTRARDHRGHGWSA